MTATTTSTEEIVTTTRGTVVVLRRDEGVQTLLCAYTKPDNPYSGGQQIAGALSHDDTMQRITGSGWSLTTGLPGLLVVPSVYVKDEDGVRAWLLFLADLHAGKYLSDRFSIKDNETGEWL
jgi:hypothetical protein